MRYQGLLYGARVWPRLFWGVVMIAAARVTYYGTHPPKYSLIAFFLLLSPYFFITAVRVAWKKRRVAWP